VPRLALRGRRTAGPNTEPDEETRAHVAGAASAAAADVAAPVTVAPDLTGAAFFDVDNTMMMGASLFWFARGLAARKYFSTRDMAGFVWQQAKFRIGGNEGNPEDMHTIRENALAFVAGRPVAEIVEASEEIYDELMADRIWSGTRALAQQHLRLGLTGALGTVAEVVDGKYTGCLVGEMMHGPAKAEAVLALAEREGLDLSRCTAYSDSANDLPMLSLCGNAVAVNPDTELRAIARARGWTIRDFRTGRKAAKIGVPTVAAAALSGGLVGGALALRRRNKFPF
jgi:phosphoserine phosphatase